MKTRLHSIEGPYFCACVITDVDKRVVKTAPILRYMSGWHIRQVKVYCKTKKWTYLEHQDLFPGENPEEVNVKVTEH